MANWGPHSSYDIGQHSSSSSNNENPCFCQETSALSEYPRIQFPHIQKCSNPVFSEGRRGSLYQEEVGVKTGGSVKMRSHLVTTYIVKQLAICQEFQEFVPKEGVALRNGIFYPLHCTQPVDSCHSYFSYLSFQETGTLL